MEPELILDAHAQLGEGPAWDAASQRLLWVDIYARTLHRFDPVSGSEETFGFSEFLGCVAPCNPAWESPSGFTGSLVVGLKSGPALVDSTCGDWDYLALPEPLLPGNRFNDGKCDPAGRFLLGSMDNAEQQATGTLYSYSPDGTLKTLLTDLRISNGLTWSPDHRTFYFIDTPTHQVQAYDYDLTTGAIANPRTVVEVPLALGWPDGMTSDSEGKLWVAIWGGACLTRWDPATGALLESIPFPALNITAPAFGGPDLTDLYVTSARKGMSADDLAKYPLSGGLFRLRPGLRGMETFTFGG